MVDFNIKDFVDFVDSLLLGQLLPLRLLGLLLLLQFEVGVDQILAPLQNITSAIKNPCSISLKAIELTHIQVLLWLPGELRPSHPLDLVVGLVVLLPRPLHGLHLPLLRLGVLGPWLLGPVGLLHLLLLGLPLQLLSPLLQLGLSLK